MGNGTRGLAVAVSVATAGWSGLRAQQPDSAAKVAKLAPITVTATRSAATVFRTATPVLVVDSATIRQELPNGVGDLFRNLPGVDVTGVGPNQGRLIIRGQRGQRILLAEDGLRLNNARRQQDFGELPSLSDVNGLSRVEVVRGPASVLYGTDAIGGVVNLITTEPPARGRDGVFGSVLYRRSTADGQNLGHARVSGRSGKLGLTVSGGVRESDEYSAPAGTFGQLTLAAPEPVRDAGVLDRNFSARLGYDLGTDARATIGVSRYEARDAGFGYVDPGALGDPNGATVRLLFPRQDVTRVTAGFRAGSLGWAVADRISVTAFTGGNDRIFDQRIDIPLGAPLPPGANIAIRGRNVTDITSYGVRAEAVKVIGGRHLVTWGADWYLDRSTNTDSTVTITTIAGPPTVRTSTTPTLPNANYWTTGLFAQAQLAVVERVTVAAGIRGQAINAKSRFTDGLPAGRSGVSASNTALVGNLGATWSVTPTLNLVATVGRAFRAPNLIERYFEGLVTEANSFQLANPDLDPETSLNLDVGFKFRTDRVYAEATFFRNTIRDGIRAVATGTQVNNRPAFQNRNIEKLRDHGLESLVEVRVGRGFTALGHFTTLDSKNVDRNDPVGDSYGTKLGGELGWTEPRGRFGLAYEVRHQGERKDIDLAGSPVGDRLPAFTVHNVRGDVRLPELGGVRPGLTIAVNNLGDALYAESSNTAFFRPEPRRNAVFAVRFDF